MQIPSQIQYKSSEGLGVRRTALELNYSTATDDLVQSLDSQRGVFLASSFEYPGRYTRWDIGFTNPPLVIVSKDRHLTIEALNQRGEIILPEIYFSLEKLAAVTAVLVKDKVLEVSVAEGDANFPEELRSRRPSVFSVLRAIVSRFQSAQDSYLGLYGAFGYDLTFQFEDVSRYQQRDQSDREMVLYLPDQIIVADHRIQQSICYNYEFVCRSWDSEKRTETTGGYKRSGEQVPYTSAIHVQQSCDHGSGEFAEQVKRAREYFKRGDLFEVVPGQCFFEPCQDTPAQVFSRLKVQNPAPYGALMNLGEQEYLIAASPEMFVRVDGSEIETCPISGTIKRGEDAIGDARQIKALLNSDKDESELSMCTDVDRNDKSRVCEPGSVEVVGRRQIEMYSRLIHTVDHVKGRLRDGFDALDAFLAHTWAVTVTGAPKHAAMQYIEENEKSPRRWYGGALGHIGFDGNLNTGLTLRTIRVKDGVAEIRAGATLLIDSDPEAEEKETRLKASALIHAVRGEEILEQSTTDNSSMGLQNPLKALMVDHQDSFVHNLAAYFRECGIELLTLRPEAARYYLRENDVDLVILSPGPSTPSQFSMGETIEVCMEKQVSIFGVCLGLQGIVEYFGGVLEQLDYPMHGKASIIKHDGSGIFSGIKKQFTAGRYHSLVAKKVPECLDITARTEDGRIMAIEHKELLIRAVQFHPESIMSLENKAGHRIIRNVVTEIDELKTLKQAG